MRIQERVCNINRKVKEVRLRWLGHVERMKDDTPAKEWLVMKYQEDREKMDRLCGGGRDRVTTRQKGGPAKTTLAGEDQSGGPCTAEQG